MSIATERPDELVEILSADFVNCWMPIAQSTLTGSVASVTFSSIPATFRSLKLFVSARTDTVAGGDTWAWRANGDSGNNYDYIEMVARLTVGVTLSGARAASFALAAQCEAANSTTNAFPSSEIFFNNYRLTTMHKWSLSSWAFFGNVSSDSDLRGGKSFGRWRSTSAITSLTLLPTSGGNFVSDSTFQLYGIL